MLQAETELHEAKNFMDRKTVEGRELQFRVVQLQKLVDSVRGERNVAAAKATTAAQVPQYSLPSIAVCLSACLLACLLV